MADSLVYKPFVSESYPYRWNHRILPFISVHRLGYACTFLRSNITLSLISNSRHFIDRVNFLGLFDLEFYLFVDLFIILCFLIFRLLLDFRLLDLLHAISKFFIPNKFFRIEFRLFRRRYNSIHLFSIFYLFLNEFN